MTRKPGIFVLTYTLIANTLNPVLYFMGEKRIDIYVVVNILVYYISYYIVRPIFIREKFIRLLNITLFIVFTSIATYRIYEVLTR